MTEKFNPYSTPKEKVNNQTFIHPSFLSNTAFITKEPVKIIDYTKEKVDLFLDRYEFTKREFSLTIGGHTRLYSELFVRRGKDNLIVNIQQVLYDIYVYDEKRNRYKKNRLFKNKSDFDIIDNFIANFELFCARHQISSSAASNYLLGSQSYIRKIMNKESGLVCSKIDNAFEMMHKIDIGLIKEMGIVYEEWIKRGK